MDNVVYVAPKSQQLKTAEIVNEQNEQSKTGVGGGLWSSSAQIWKSRLSWRITFAVFLTFMTVQAGILSFTIEGEKRGHLYEIEETAKAVIRPIIDPTALSRKAVPIDEATAKRLFLNTKITGITLYDNQLNFMQSYGRPVFSILKDYKSIQNTHYSADGQSYEFTFADNTLAPRYYITTRTNSSDIRDKLISYVIEAIKIMMLMSAFVTTVLMIALGRWLLEPILFMRENLMAASENPENPKITQSPFNDKDEIGSAIEVAQQLIRQNAENIRQIKSSAEDKIHKLAYYDTLTTLPNRTLFLQTMSEIMRKNTGENTQRFAVIAIDLDHFKDVNDSMGHNVGDAILRGVGKRLREATPESATVSRTGEDEFVVMMLLDKASMSSRSLAEKLRDVVRGQPFKVFNEEFQIRSSIGVATYPDDGTDPDQVLKNADIALNRAKEEGRDTIKEYSEDFDRAVQYRFQMLRDLRDALEHDQLTLHYHPQLDLKTEKIIGAEALLRWWKPDNSKEGGRFIPPGEFIPVAESSGLIVPIGEWVLKTACQAAREWKQKHGIDIRIAINVAAAQFSQGNLVEHVKKTLKETGLDANRLELEVTESVFMDDIEHTIQTLKELNAMGVELAIDDFGTGYSSLSYLRQFPIDRLKIDQSFIRNALNNPDDASIAKTIVNLGHSLNLKVIAEGVETIEHETFLIKEGCDEVQGFRYTKPIPHKDLINFVKNYDGKLESFNK